ncbi:MAG: PDZ domain-containing protein, partial [Verrucomicrobia bacterium]|nr:PDZ domain-containing protein [Verrucomicrobiota bacterium]
MNVRSFLSGAVGLGTLAVLLFFPDLSGQGNGFRGLEKRIQELFAEHRSAMVRVKAVYPPETTGQEDGENGEEPLPQVVIGSGFFISREGLIITNASIVINPLRVWVEHDSIAYGAEVIGYDKRSNMAFLRTHTLPDSFSFFHLVDRPGLPPIGSFLLRLSMPLEFKASPHFGLVSGYESRFAERFFPCLYIRTSIPAGPGDGGSAYLDLSGRLVGVQVGSLPDVGSSYILPARAAMRIRDDILFSGSVTYGWIGFEVDVQSSVRDGRRLVLTEVFPDTPAEAVGLLEGDLLRRIGDYEIRTLDDLRNAIFYTRVGQYVDVVVERDGEERVYNVRVAARPENEPMEIVEPVPAGEPILNPLTEEARQKQQEAAEARSSAAEGDPQEGS